MSEDEIPAAQPLLPWHAAALAQWAQLPRTHHALLLIGDAFSGVDALARAQARAWLCNAPRDGQGCGACESCHWLMTGVHPDFLAIEPEEPEADAATQARREIKIAAIRALGDWAYTSAHRTGKVVLIDPADAMNAQAANALLKLLEEPPSRVRFVLTASDRRRLPATIVSRCLAQRAPTPAPGEALSWLQSSAPELHERAPTLLAQAGGSPLHAIALANSAIQDARQRFLQALANPRELSALAEGDLLDAITKSERKDALGQRLDWLIAWVHDLATVGAGSQPRYNSDFRPSIEKLAKQLPALPWFRYYANLIGQRKILQHPLSPRLVLEDALLQYKAIATGAI